MSSLLAELGITRIINATGTVTRLGASRISPDVIAAMAAAAECSVDIAELQGRACDLIARHTGAEAGIVTAGAMAGLLVGAAACLTGLDPVKMSRLPDSTGMPNEFIVPRSHRNSYDHGVLAAGARLVEVGLGDRSNGCGVRDTEAWEIASAITERTAGIVYFAHAGASPPLSAVIEVARHARVPVLVDAAAELPPASNLRRFIDEGADLVVFSGGKGIGGPAATGILCGRRSLVGAALLQQLDLDYVYADWNPPANLIDKRDLPGVPRHGIGRPCKVGKEQIVGLLTALQRFCATDDAERNREFARITDVLLHEIPGAQGFSVRAIRDAAHGDMPLVEVTVSGALTAVETAARLRATTPAIYVDATHADTGRLILVPTCLTVQDAAVIGGAFARIAAR